MIPFVVDARPDVPLEKSVGPSVFPLAHGPFAAGRLRAAGFDHPSPLAPGIAEPFGCEPGLDVTVDVDELEVVDDTDEEEFVRWRDLRCVLNMLIPLASSEDDEVSVVSDCPPLIHPGRLRFEKLGGFATAVMRNAR